MREKKAKIEKKRKGGKEKQGKEKKALATDAAKSRNIINMFAAARAGGGGIASGSGALAAPGPSQEDSEIEAPTAMVVQEGEEEIGGGDSRCVC